MTYTTTRVLSKGTRGFSAHHMQVNYSNIYDIPTLPVNRTVHNILHA